MNSQQNSCFYEFEGFVLDPQQRVVRSLADGQVVRLTARAFDALHLLVDHHGQLVDKETLIKALWPKVVVEENNLTQIIHSLRQTLGEKPGEHRFIATAPGRGYRFVAAVREVPRVSATSDAMSATMPPIGIADAMPAPASTELAVTGAVRTGTTASRSLFIAWGVLALVLIGMASTWWLVERNGTVNTTSGQQAAPATSVAVLPFVNLTGDPSKDYLGDGIAEELVNTLNKVPGLRVPAPTSSFAYKGRNTDIRQIAKDLGVSTILEGSVRAADKRIRITAQLINAQDGLHLWTKSYDEEFTDIFRLQDQLATQIVKALQPNLSAAAQAPPTKDIEAYRRYLQASSLMDEPAIDLLSQAVARDPNFAQAYGRLAAAHFSLYMRGSAAKNLAMAQQFARQALSFGPNATAQYVLGEYSYLAGEWVDMDARDRAVLAVAGAEPRLFARRSVHLLSVGKVRSAVETAQHAYDMAPASPRINASLARTLFVQGRQTEAVKLADLATTLGLPKVEVAYIYAKATRDAGEYARAAELVNASFVGSDLDERTRQNLKETVRMVHAALADPSKRAAALVALGRSYPGPQTASSNPVALVKRCMTGTKWFVLLQAIDEAYALAMQCPDIGNGLAIGAVMENNVVDFWGLEMRPFRRDTRFQTFATRIGLMEYWKKYGPPDDCDLKDGKLTCH